MTVWWNCWHLLWLKYVLWLDFLKFTPWGICRDKKRQSVVQCMEGHREDCCRSGKIAALCKKIINLWKCAFVPLTAFPGFSQRLRFIFSQRPRKHCSCCCLARWEAWFLSGSPKIHLSQSYNVRLSVIVCPCFYALHVWGTSKFFPDVILLIFFSTVTVASNPTVPSQ